MNGITTIKIHPAIGVARVGNSPSDFFVGPELPGDRSPPNGGYKDRALRIKRQAARFRIFGYDSGGNLVKELLASNASVTWTVHLANKKAAWRRFEGLKQDAAFRNAGVNNRKSLIIDPGPRSLTAVDKVAHFDSGSFLGAPVPLGEIRTDKQGRLLVLGGFGRSASPTNAPIEEFANNDGWFDDVSDGPVTATVKLHDMNQTIEAAGAWVIVGPPNFAPAIDSVITLYDVLFQVAVDKLGLNLADEPSFTRDIYPILNRVTKLRWVSKLAGSAHQTLAGTIPPPGSDALRNAIFQRLRDPNDGSGGDMPMIWSDNYRTQPVRQRTRHPMAEHEAESQPLTKVQYLMMKQWRDGHFINDWAGLPAADTQITPAGLDRAALEPCVGGAFYPGIEAGWLMRDVYMFKEPFRLSHDGLSAGDITKQMSIPWQSDFSDCKQEDPLAWWPAQRPDDVFPARGKTQVAWTRGIVSGSVDMIRKWHRLGVVVQQGDKYVETGRKTRSGNP
jgi:hypothetical protein